MNGRIKTLRETFGFITAADGREFFFHDSDLVEDFDLSVGDSVTFEPVEPAPVKGPRAQQVVFVEAVK
jgi:cold shock CspA family protein